MKRALEPEIMDEVTEVKEFAGIIDNTKLGLIEDCFAVSAVNLCRETGRVIDLGTGAGSIPIKIAQLNPNLEIIALDLSEPMLELAYERAKTAGVEDKISFIVGDMKDTGYKESHFDGVVSNFTLHHLENPKYALGEIRRIVKEDGGILVRDLVRPINKLALSLYVGVFGKDHTPIQKELYRNSLAAALSFRELKSLARESGMDRVNFRKYFITHIGIERYATNPHRANIEDLHKVDIMKYSMQERNILRTYITQTRKLV